jgi:7,8-dihydropterin-6-yl-methyl-4-(beta-D-ribofuranosyl)aminobenzene 5'-phosphate synthase
MHNSRILRGALGLALVFHLALLFGCTVPSPDAATTAAQPTPTVTVEPTVVPKTPTAPTGEPSLTPSAPAEGEPSTQEGPPPAEAQEDQVAPEEARGVRITIVYDNYPYDPRLQTQWGFAALVEFDGHTVLFDTGGDGPTLLGNLAKLGIDPSGIEAVVLSHIHGDHTGGLPDLMGTGIQPVVYVPASFPSSFKDSVRLQTELVEVSEPLDILSSLHVTGEIGSAIVEQGLVVETGEGIVVITGCAHPGIARMVERAHEMVPGEIALVMGGFHLGDAGRASIGAIIADFRGMGVRQVSPTHCTGDLALQMFAEEYGDDFVQGGVGRVIIVGPEP